MKTNVVVDILPQQYIEKLLIHCQASIYNTESEIIYEGHIPTAGYLLLEGEVQFIKRKRVVQTLGPRILFGVTELMESSPMKHTVKISEKAKVCILDKSTVKELLEKLSTDELPHIFKALVA